MQLEIVLLLSDAIGAKFHHQFSLHLSSFVLEILAAGHICSFVHLFIFRLIFMIPTDLITDVVWASPVGEHLRNHSYAQAMDRIKPIA